MRRNRQEDAPLAACLEDEMKGALLEIANAAVDQAR